MMYRTCSLLISLWLTCCQAQVVPVYRDAVPEEPVSPILEGVCLLSTTNPCVPEATCYLSVPVVGEALCRCKGGYEGTGRKDSGGCKNINECIGANTCDQRSQECVDTPGSYECRCKPGYTLAPNRRTCVDINECANPNLNTCDGVTSICLNIEGSYECRCTGENMIVDELTGKCRDMNECKDKNGIMNPCDHPELCLDLNPGVECACRKGYNLAADGQSCLDNDECTLGTHTCDVYGPGAATCQNTEGSYACNCSMEKGWIQNPTDPRVCDNLNECRHQPYICGGAESCCGDLMPPEKYACMLPISATAVAEMQTARSAGSSTLVDPMNGLSMNRVPVGPAAQSLVSATHTQPGIMGSDVYRSGSNTDTQLLELQEQIEQEKLQQLIKLQEELEMLKAKEKTNEPVPCFQQEILYDNQPLPGGVFKIPTLTDCQTRCYEIGDCNFFSFHMSAMECRLFTNEGSLKSMAGWTSGPSSCQKNLISGQGLEENEGGVQPPPEFERLGRAVLGTLSELINHDSTSSTLPRNALSALEESVDFVLVVAGETAPEDIPELLLSKAKERVRTLVEDYDILNVEKLGLISDKVLESLRLILDDPKSTIKLENPLDTQNNPSLSLKNSVGRRLQRNILRGGIRDVLPDIRGIPGVGSLLSDDDQQCPPGFNHAQDLYRAKMRSSALRSIQTAIQGSTDAQGHQTQGLTPDGFTRGVVRNANDLAGAMTAWYTEIARVPGEVFTASNNLASAVDPTPALQQVAGEKGIPPGAVTTAELLAASIGTGLMVSGVNKLVYGNGPGDSLILDRTGKSKRMVYDF